MFDDYGAKVVDITATLQKQREEEWWQRLKFKLMHLLRDRFKIKGGN